MYIPVIFQNAMILSLENITVAWEKRSVSQDYQRICAIYLTHLLNPGIHCVSPGLPRFTLKLNRLKSSISKKLGYIPIICIFLFMHCFSVFGMAPKLNWEKAIEKTIKKYGLPTEPALIKMMAHAGVAYPPKDVALLAFKKERELQLWAKDENQSWRYIHTYPLTAFSGRLGPKLKEHDLQIPEGVYRLTTLNPFSSMHLSMMINYPNGFDRLQAIKDGRTRLGNNIFLHGKSFSVGCLAVGDKAIDQIFLLVYRVGLSHVQLIIAPNDLRTAKPATSAFAQPRWLPELYTNIQQALGQFPVSRTELAVNNPKKRAKHSTHVLAPQ